MILPPVSHLPVNDPLLFEMDSLYEEVVSSELVFSFTGKDSVVGHDMYLLRDGEGNPRLYYANINTPVCIDNVCKPVFIEVYWDLLGNYIGFGVYKDQPLTKYDHDLFEADDFVMLHNLLLDKHSILERRKLSDLFDPNAVPERQVEYKGQKVDAVSGATIREIKESVVEGALFSCYTLWHLVNGNAARIIGDHLDLLETEEVLAYFFNSPYKNYQYYAIKKLSSDGMDSSFAQVLHVFQHSPAMVRAYILKKLPAKLWGNSEKALALSSGFSQYDINTRTLILEKLEHTDNIVVSALVDDVPLMTKNQLRMYLQRIEEIPKNARSDVLMLLEQLLAENQFVYQYLVEDFLSGS